MLFYSKILQSYKMEKLLTDILPKIKLLKIRMRFRVIPSLHISIRGVHKIEYLGLPDSSYGEWIIYQGNIPKYYFSFLNDDGVENKISQYIDKHNTEYESFLIKLLRSEGYKNINFIHKNSILIYYHKKSYIADIPLLQIVDG